jgi:hypothetical protein
MLKDAARAMEAISARSFMVKVDLEDAFWHIPISEQH